MLSKTKTPRPRVAGALLALFALQGFSAGPAAAYEWSQENSCVLFNACNTNPLVEPFECTSEENLAWCNCVRAVLTHPIKGQASGVELGAIWVMRQDGVGNLRLNVRGGTLDLSGLEVGDLIGETLVNELIPEQAGVPPGTFFFLRSETRVTAKGPDSVDFEIRVVQLNLVTQLILRYVPTDAAHSNGVTYRGRVTARGPGEGFVAEFRYEGQEGSASPGIEIGDATNPGFNVRFSISFFTADTEAASVFTLPADAPFVVAESTLRRFGEDADLGEVLPLGEADLCQLLTIENPCRHFGQDLRLSDAGSNNPPSADICVTDALTLEPLAGDIFIECGEGRALFRGSNSTDGDGGSQGLTYRWEVVEGPEGGAIIPAETAAFRDTEISFLIPGSYEVRLTVDDGQAANRTDVQEVTVSVVEGFQPENLPPEVLSLRVNGVELIGEDELLAVVEFAGEPVVVAFDAQLTSGNDGCLQELFGIWEHVSGPAAVVFDNPNDDDPNGSFSLPGEYVVSLSVDDGAPENHLTVIEITILVQRAGNTFQRCDPNASGNADLSDSIFTFNFLFLGGPEPRCREAMNCNADAGVDVSDGVFNLNYQFLGGPAPAPPFPACDRAGEDRCASATPCQP